MNFLQELIGKEWFFIPIFGLLVFLCLFFVLQPLIDFITRNHSKAFEKTSFNLDLIFVDVEPKQLNGLIIFSSFGLGILFFLLAWPNFIASLILFAVITPLGWLLPPLVTKFLWEKRSTEITNQMVDGMTIMANGIKAGLSITQCMERVLEHLSGPLSQEFKIALNKVRLGRTVEDALSEMAERVPKQDVQMLVTSINILKETGGNLGETFETINFVVRERQKLEKKIQAMTATGTFQGLILSSVPFLLLAFFSFADPTYVKPLYNTMPGLLSLGGVVFLVCLGGLMIKKIVSIKV